MAFYVYRSNRLELLLQALTRVVREPAPPVDPLRSEIVVVQSRALGRYVSHRLADALGAWACPDFPFPRRVIDQALGAVLGDGEAARSSVFTEARLSWAVARMLPRCLEEEPEVFAPVRRYLESERGLGVAVGPPWPPARLLSLSAQVATVLDRYVVYRPDWILRWDRAPEDHWQSHLWHRLVGTYGQDGGAGAGAGASAGAPGHLAARALALAAAARDLGRLPDGLPPRLLLFGIRTLPPLFLRVFATLARVLDLHLFQLTPSAGYYADLRTADASGSQGDANPLLASQGRLGRELQDLLEELGGDYQEVGAWHLDPAPELTDAGPARAADASALAVLQSDVLHLRHRRPGGPPGEQPLVLRPDDRSLSIHSSFGRMREVEALRDQLLAAFEELPGLQPRDVAVMAPSMDAYAPYVEAVFGVAPEDPAYLPFSVSDREARAEQGVVDAFLGLLGLLPTRLSAPEVFELLSMAPVRERFGIAPQGLETLAGWLAAAGIRWGVDAADRAAQGQPSFGEYTWRFGLDRLLLGYAGPGDGWTPFQGVLPQPGAQSSPELLGSLLDFSEALFTARREAAHPATPAEWRIRLLSWLGKFLHEGPELAWQHQLLREALETLVSDAALAGFDERVDLAAMRSLLEAQVSQPSPPREFQSSGITFCSLLPMRSVPFRVVALLGLSEDQFPRQDRRPAFDLMSEAPRPGDPSPRHDDRYLFLEALLAARERLILCYVGGDARDQTARPPSVLVSELLDVLADSFEVPAQGDEAPSASSTAAPPALARRRRAVQRLVVRHPLRPFDARYFGPGGPQGLFTFDRAQLRAARAHLGPKRPSPPFLEAPLPPPLPEDRGRPAGTEEVLLPLDALERFWRQPCGYFLQQRLGLSVPEEGELLEAREPSAPDDLAAWRVRDVLLSRVQASGSFERAWEALSARALLPLGAPGRVALAEQLAQVRPLGELLAALLAEEPLAPVHLSIALGLPGWRVGELMEAAGPFLLTGRLRGLNRRAQVDSRAGHLRAQDQLRAWIRHLALCALDAEGLPGTTLTIGTGSKGVEAVWFERISAQEATGRLQDLATLFAVGQRVPLRFFPRSSLAFAQAGAKGPEAATGAARNEFVSTKDRPGEDADPSVARLFPQGVVLDEKQGLGPCGEPSEAFSFAALAQRVWSPLLAARREGTP